MTWFRKVVFKFTYQCCYEQQVEEEGKGIETVEVPMLVKRVESEEQEIIQEYEDRPTDTLDEWAARVTKEQAEEDADKSCKELAAKYYQCLLEIEIIDKTESLPPKIPEFVLETIIDLERRRDEAKTKERKDAIQKAIDELKKEYSIS